MDQKIKRLLIVSGISLLPLFTATVNAAITDPGNGNPLAPGFFADPFVFYDSSTIYLYPTTDGYDDGTFMYFGPFGVWHSTDFVNWTFKTLVYPADFPYNDSRLWAPSVTKGANGTYFMYYIRSGDSCYIVSSASALGPWANVKNGRRISTPHMFDTDVFKDDDGSYYVVFQQHIGSNFSIAMARLASTMDTITGAITTLYSSGTALAEGATIFKRNSVYYLTFSQGSLSSSYHVVYGYCRTAITGPYTIGGTILQSNSGENIVATGHNSVLKIDTNYYIVYHRWRYPTTNTRVFRQPCADRLNFNTDGTIPAITPTNTGVGALGPVSITDSNVARGKSATASSQQSADYSAARAIDENNATLWRASSTSYPQSLTIDLGRSYSISRVETCFEFPTEYYRYVMATSIDNAVWTTYADRSASTLRVSPVIDTGNATARYIRITIQSSSLQTNPVFHGTPAAGIWEVKVRKNSQAGLRLPGKERNSGVNFLRVINIPQGKLRFEWHCESRAAATLVIYNVQGKRVRLFPAQSSGNFLVWDGTDQSGRRLGEGVYQVTVESGKSQFTVSVVYVR